MNALNINTDVINHSLINANMSSKHEIIKTTPIYDKTQYHPVVASAVFYTAVSSDSRVKAADDEDTPQ